MSRLLQRLRLLLLRWRAHRAVRSWHAHQRWFGPDGLARGLGAWAERLSTTDAEDLSHPVAATLDRGTLDALVTLQTAVGAYLGATHLLAHGPTYSWSALVLLRTSFEASLRVSYALTASIPLDLQLARMLSAEIGSHHESAKRNGMSWNDAKLDDARGEITARASAMGLKVRFHRKGATIDVPTGEKVRSSLNVTEEAEATWGSLGESMYRRLSAFTHGSSELRALSTVDALVAVSFVNEALWWAMNDVARWVGFPTGLVKRRFRLVKSACERWGGFKLNEALPPDVLADAVELGARTAGANDREARRFARKWSRWL